MIDALTFHSDDDKMLTKLIATLEIYDVVFVALH